MSGPPSERDKMLAGQPWHAGDPELVAQQALCAAWLARYKASLFEPAGARVAGNPARPLEG